LRNSQRDRGWNEGGFFLADKGFSTWKNGALMFLHDTINRFATTVYEMHAALKNQIAP
jgi:hypothetical protein